MKRFIISCVLPLLLLVLPAGASPQTDGSLALVGGMLLDGHEVPPVHDPVVLIEGNRIVRVGTRSDVDIPADARIIDTRGKTILPGLIDLHAHLDILGHGDYVSWFRWVDANSDWQTVYEISGRQLLMAGVTAGVDLAAPLDLLEARGRFDRNELPGPRLHVSGPWITRVTMGGIPLDIQNVVSSPEEAAEEARRLIEQGADVIKLWDGLTEEDMRAVVEVARPHGVRVHRHLYEPEDIRAALRAGVDVLQHVGSAGEPPYPAELVEEIAQRSVPIVQTIAHRIWVWPATLEFPTRLHDPLLQEQLPPDMYREVMRSVEDYEHLGYFRTTPRQIRNAELGGASQFIEANAFMGVGTDSGTPLNFHTEAMWREMSALVDAGMTPLQVISAATKNGAQIMGLYRDIGTIEPGKLADIIVVDGNPLFDINVLGHVDTVIKDGVVWKHEGRTELVP